MTIQDWNKALLALVMWREAQGEGIVGMQAVGNVIMNRALHADLTHVICAKWQFSSMTATGDPMLTRWPEAHDRIFEQAMVLAESLIAGTCPDSTEGATHYFNPHVVMPTWAAQMTKIKSIGNHDFYK